MIIEKKKTVKFKTRYLETEVSPGFANWLAVFLITANLIFRFLIFLILIG